MNRSYISVLVWHMECMMVSVTFSLPFCGKLLQLIEFFYFFLVKQNRKLMLQLILMCSVPVWILFVLGHFECPLIIFLDLGRKFGPWVKSNDENLPRECKFFVSTQRSKEVKFIIHTHR